MFLPEFEFSSYVIASYQIGHSTESLIVKSCSAALSIIQVIGSRTTSLEQKYCYSRAIGYFRLRQYGVFIWDSHQASVVVVITNAKLHQAKSERRFRQSSNPAGSVLRGDPSRNVKPYMSLDCFLFWFDGSKM